MRRSDRRLSSSVGRVRLVLLGSPRPPALDRGQPVALGASPLLRCDGQRGTCRSGRLLRCSGSHGGDSAGAENRREHSWSARSAVFAQHVERDADAPRLVGQQVEHDAAHVFGTNTGGAHIMLSHIVSRRSHSLAELCRHEACV